MERADESVSDENNRADGWGEGRAEAPGGSSEWCSKHGGETGTTERENDGGGEGGRVASMPSGEKSVRMEAKRAEGGKGWTGLEAR